ncbi:MULTISPECIES: TetR/AcrR family transcriptional regulator [unclassified Mycolicibacterium]|uniref:TetR/AcrR family transcriptional regulator n=1 Tax=unclassified Mycolicibacterium TaxID=2636767 RepID=UPI0012DE6D37|nr:MULTISPECIES: TetR/AcrR family transcriptional regulator [unclassified Mycolicibacterium]MUL82517.1 TetR/AcrR family transcriptional regulator [Mycolicibacterium sp. CBMA 329]MUL91351.1 TetR/AcrR family transcriptional regulator [Mycolicibacterium sp. CBMA 331]MUM01474.1 TetR/AcrR family transcriptional regulator [Mycolicibacterium sp. CBMA 334]MUM29703.1 TetR/AcrR family transcriptional regulator [Mycolicibacterium sp. CBMA 295]MUM41775.1 TetR/AcrR family transcriptional regulator [Mycolic
MSTTPQGTPARSPVDRRQPQRSDQRRTAILAALDEHQRQTGFDAINIAEVARAAGVGRSAFYFDNKAAAVAALLEPMHEALLAANTILANTAEPPRSRVRDTLEAVARTAEEHRYLFQAMWEASGINAAVRDMWDDARESFVPAVAAVIAGERAAGRAPDGPEPRVLASLLMELNDRLVERIIVGGPLTRQQLLEGAEAMWMGTVYGTISESGASR